MALAFPAVMLFLVAVTLYSGLHREAGRVATGLLMAVFLLMGLALPLVLLVDMRGL